MIPFASCFSKNRFNEAMMKFICLFGKKMFGYAPWVRFRSGTYIKDNLDRGPREDYPQGDSAWFCADKSAGMRVGEE